MRTELLVQGTMNIHLQQAPKGVSAKADLLELFLGCWPSCCTGRH